MNTLKQLQQETEEMFDEKFKELRIVGYHPNDGFRNVLLDETESFKSFIHSRESIAYKAGMEKVKGLIERHHKQNYGLIYKKTLSEINALIDEEIKQ